MVLISISATASGLFAPFSNSLEKIEFNNIDTSRVTNMGGMFYGCSNLINITLSSFNTSNVTSSMSMFYYCSLLVGGNGTVYDSSKTNESYAHIDGGLSNPGYLTRKGV